MATRPPAVAAASDVAGRDGSVVVLEPRTTAQVRVPLGTSVEVVLLPGLGEAVESANADILTATANPPCHLTAICGIPRCACLDLQDNAHRARLSEDRLRVQGLPGGRRVHDHALRVQADRRVRSTPVQLSSGDRDVGAVFRKPAHTALDHVGDALDGVPAGRRIACRGGRARNGRGRAVGSRR